MFFPDQVYLDQYMPHTWPNRVRYGRQRTKAAQVALLQRLWPRERRSGKAPIGEAGERGKCWDHKLFFLF